MSETKMSRNRTGNNSVFEPKPKRVAGKKNAPKPPVTKKKKSKFKHLLMGFGFSGIAVCSMAFGAFLALSLSDTPLRQARLTAEEEAVFNNEETLTYDSLQIPKLSRPVNILVLGVNFVSFF